MHNKVEFIKNKELISFIIELQKGGRMMETVKNIQKAIDYIEENIYGHISIDDISKEAYMSVSTFQRLFLALCGITIGEYIRLRKLTLAGKEIITSNNKIIDVAFKYGYESHESFSRAFLRFHNVSPIIARNSGEINSFSKISVESILEGNETMGTNWFFQSENSICNLRGAGVLIQNGKILLQREKGRNEYAIPGGLVIQGETTEQAVVRRYKEEANIQIKCEKLIWVEESFWEWNNKNAHTVSFYYSIELDDCNAIPNNNKFTPQIGNDNVEYGWVDIRLLNNLIIYPSFAKTEVFNISNEVKHFVSHE